MAPFFNLYDAKILQTLFKYEASRIVSVIDTVQPQLLRMSENSLVLLVPSKSPQLQSSFTHKHASSHNASLVLVSI